MLKKSAFESCSCVPSVRGEAHISRDGHHGKCGGPHSTASTGSGNGCSAAATIRCMQASVTGMASGGGRSAEDRRERATCLRVSAPSVGRSRDFFQCELDGQNVSANVLIGVLDKDL